MAIDASGCVNLQDPPLASLFASVSGKTSSFITPAHDGLISASVLKSSPAGAAQLISELDRCSAKWPEEGIVKTAVDAGMQYTAPFRGTSIVTTMIVRPNGYIIAVSPNVFAMGKPVVTELLSGILSATR